MAKEFIICAAIWYDDGTKCAEQPTNIESGFVVCGRRHSDCYVAIASIVGPYEAIRIKLNTVAHRMDKRLHQGFLTSTNRYVDRKEAYQIAVANDQIVYGKDLSGDDEPILISENLY